MKKSLASRIGLTYIDLIIWAVSAALVVAAFCIFDRHNYLNLAVSVVGVTALIYIAKGNPIGQVLTILFSVLYGIISFRSAYYGEMLTYLGMTAPMAIIALVSWLRHPYRGHRNEVEVNHLRLREIPLMLTLTAAVTAVFYPLLAYFRTENLIPSTLSVTTSFLAVYLTFRRSPYYALAYAANDIVLIVLWVLASIRDISNLSVVMCFTAFFINDIWGFISWAHMERRQKHEAQNKAAEETT